MGLGQRFLTVRVVYTVSDIVHMRLNAAQRCFLAPLLRPLASWPTGGRCPALQPPGLVMDFC